MINRLAAHPLTRILRGPAQFQWAALLLRPQHGWREVYCRAGRGVTRLRPSRHSSGGRASRSAGRSCSCTIVRGIRGTTLIGLSNYWCVMPVLAAIIPGAFHDLLRCPYGRRPRVRANSAQPNARWQPKSHWHDSSTAMLRTPRICAERILPFSCS